MADTLSVVQDVLDNMVNFRRPPIGLNYVAYAVETHSNSAPDGEMKIVTKSSNKDYLEHLLKNFSGPSKTADDQIELWERLLPLVHKAMSDLDDKLVETGQGENVRVVFDVDMGGYFYNRISRHAILFGATVDQAQINNGRCDREMQQMVSEIQAVFTAHGA